MKIKRIKSSTGDYNHWLRDKESTLNEKGLISLLINLPPDWNIYESNIPRSISYLTGDKEETIAETFTNLIRKRYFRIEPIKNPYSENDIIGLNLLVFENNEDNKGETLGEHLGNTWEK